MSGRILTGAFVGSIVLFVFGFLWYGMLPIGDASFSQLPNEAAVVQTMVDAKLTSGTYIYPRMNRNGGQPAMDAWSAQHEKGPLFEIRYHAAGSPVGGAGMMLTGFAHFLLSAIVAAWLLRVALPLLRSYGQRVVFIAGLGVFAAIALQPSGPIWMFHPWDRALSDMAYTILSWLFAGLAMAAIIKPSVEVTPEGAVRTTTRSPVAAA